MMYIILFLSILFSQNFLYKSNDWYTVSNPGQINSISSSYNQIYFCSDNGIYTYDVDTGSLIFELDYLTQLDSSKPVLIHYDEHTDYIWYLNQNSLNYKPRISTFWRQIHFHELNISSYRMINNIGSDYKNVYIDVGHSILVINQLSGMLESNQGDYDYNLIKWSSSSKNKTASSIDLSSYFSFEGYQIISNNKIEYNGKIIYINCIYEDQFHDLWLGTNTGEIFYCDSKMRSIQKLNSIPLIVDFNVSYIDSNEQWWFSTNNYIFLNESVISNHPVFFVHWNEKENLWKNYTKNKFSYIESKDITCFNRVDNWLYIGTKKGLIVFNIYDEEWYLFDESNGVKSNYISDITYAENNIYIATDSGISVLTTIGNKLFSPYIFDVFDNSQIFKLNKVNDEILITSEIGVFEFNYNKNEISIISDEKYLNAFYINDNSLVGIKRNKVFLLSNDKELLLSLNKIRNIELCDNFLWVNNYNKAIILNLEDKNMFEYSHDDGIVGEVINDLGCDSDWVWFTTNKGLSMYNWSKYHYVEK